MSDIKKRLAQRHTHYHQFGINRGAADAAVERLQLRAHLLEIEKSVNASEQVIFGDVVIEAEIVKQLRRRRLRPHHRSAPPQSNTRRESRRPIPINRRLNQQYRRRAAIELYSKRISLALVRWLPKTGSRRTGPKRQSTR
jgi:hypothetical protein